MHICTYMHIFLNYWKDICYILKCIGTLWSRPFEAFHNYHQTQRTADRSTGGEHAWALMVRPGSIHRRRESSRDDGRYVVVKQIAFLVLVFLIEQPVVVAMSDLCDLCSDSRLPCAPPVVSPSAPKGRESSAVYSCAMRSRGGVVDEAALLEAVEACPLRAKKSSRKPASWNDWNEINEINVKACKVERVETVLIFYILFLFVFFRDGLSNACDVPAS